MGAIDPNFPFWENLFKSAFFSHSRRKFGWFFLNNNFSKVFLKERWILFFFLVEIFVFLGESFLPPERKNDI